MNKMMHATERELQMYGNRVEILRRGETDIVYRLSDQQGEIIMTSFSVFPGIDLIFNEVNAPSCGTGVTEDLKNVIEIEYCRKGRVECQTGNCYFYLMPGDISVHRKEDAGHETVFPSGQYQGVTLSIDLERAPLCMERILGGMPIDLKQLEDRFCNGPDYFVCRQKQTLEQAFTQLYGIPEQMRAAFFKIKVLEILLLINALEVVDGKKPRMFSSPQVLLAKTVAQYLSEHLGEHPTIVQLAEQFGISETQLKDSFSGVYGIPLYRYAKIQKMKSAATMLQNTNHSVLEVAAYHGYENGSKFARAFSDVMGVTPHAYRKAASVCEPIAGMPNQELSHQMNETESR